jgi:hypothetical protein
MNKCLILAITASVCLWTGIIRGVEILWPILRQRL